MELFSNVTTCADFTIDMFKVTNFTMRSKHTDLAQSLKCV